MKPMTDIERRLVVDATLSPLQRYRRGYAATKQGPFYSDVAMRKAIVRGLVRRTPGGPKGGKFTAWGRRQ